MIANFSRNQYCRPASRAVTATCLVRVLSISIIGGAELAVDSAALGNVEDIAGDAAGDAAGSLGEVSADTQC